MRAIHIKNINDSGNEIMIPIKVVMLSSSCYKCIDTNQTNRFVSYKMRPTNVIMSAAISHTINTTFVL